MDFLDIKYYIWLTSLLGVGPEKGRKLLEHFKGAKNVYNADREEYLCVEGITQADAQKLADKSLLIAEHIFETCQTGNVQIISIDDAKYPEKLKNIWAPPIVIYVKGELPPIDGRLSIAVVGTRRPTLSALAVSRQISAQLSRRGALIVSGMAKGVDTFAHNGALKAGYPTVAVLGCGVDVCYPPENHNLKGEIEKCGAVISEFPPNTRPLAGNFPVRNRIISGLCDGVLVVEAGERSGALITANHALEQGRDVFAIPGNIESEKSVGTNSLIKQGAYLVTSAEDILSEYQNIYGDTLTPAESVKIKGEAIEPAQLSVAQQSKGITISGDKDSYSEAEKKILDVLFDGECHIDDICEKSKLTPAETASAVTLLVIKGIIDQSGAQIYRIIS